LGITGTIAWALLAGAREGYDYATTSPRFEVRALLFEPTTHIDHEAVRALMALPPGTNILSLELEDIAARVVSNPWVETASVVRVLPDALDVSVVEYEPRAVLMAAKPMLVDGKGHAFKRLEAGERGRLPLVTGVSDVMLLTNPEESELRITRAIDVLTAWETKIRPRLGEIHVAEAGEVTVYTAEVGTQLVLGRGELAPALERYDALRAAIGDDAETLAVVHLNHTPGPDRPDRVIATFLPTQTPDLLAEAEAEAVARTEQAAQDALKADERKERRSRKRRGQRRAKQQSRLPKYQ